MDVAARNVRLQLSGGAQPALRSRWYGDYEINPLSRASRRAKALGYPGRSPPARAISDYLFKDHVTVHPWGHPQTWERGRPARTVSPRARCPRSRRHHLVTVHTWGHPQPWECGRPARIASPRARCSRSRRYHLVTVHPWGHPQTWERGRPARTASPRARCPGDIIGYLFTPGVIHKPGSAGVPPAPRLQEQDALAPGDIISPRARCPRSRRHGTRTPAAASPPGSML
jgi:hypothetical protein